MNLYKIMQVIVVTSAHVDTDLNRVFIEWEYPPTSMLGFTNGTNGLSLRPMWLLTQLWQHQ